MHIQRIQHQFLKDWFLTKPRKPLIMRGARQVGKSTLVRHFAEVEGLRLAEVNLEEHRTAIPGEHLNFPNLGSAARFWLGLIVSCQWPTLNSGNSDAFGCPNKGVSSSRAKLRQGSKGSIARLIGLLSGGWLWNQLV